MMLLHPSYLWGLAALSLPALAHLMGTRPPVRQAFAALMFLPKQTVQKARGRRFSDVRVLCVRLLLVALCVVALARPMGVAAQHPEGPRRLALVIDLSASMAFIKDGQPLSAKAVTLAARALDDLNPGDSAALIVAGQEAPSGRVVVSPTPDLFVVRQALQQLDATSFGRSNLSHAQTLAHDLLAPRPGVVMLISDLAQSAFSQANAWPVSADGQKLVVVDAAQRPTLASLRNVAIVEAVWQPSARAHTPGGPEASTLKVVVRNFGNETEDDCRLLVCCGHQLLAQTHVDVHAQSDVHKVLPVAANLPSTADIHIKLVPDHGAFEGLVADDTAWLRVERPQDTRIWVVGSAFEMHNAEEQADPVPTAMRLVAQALRAPTPFGGRFLVSEVGIEHLAERLVTASSQDSAEIQALPHVLVIVDVPKLSALEAEAIAAHRQAHGGIIWAPGPHVSADGSDQDLRGQMPVALRTITQAGMALLDGDNNALLTGLGLAMGDNQHPILKGLGHQVEDSLRASRTQRRHNVDVTQLHGVKPLLVFDDGVAAVVTTQAQRGDASGPDVVFCTSFDLSWTDLPLRSAFVPILQRAAVWASGQPQRTGDMPKPLSVGQRLDVAADVVSKASAVKSMLAWSGPDGRLYPTHADASDDAVIANQSGLWRLKEKRPGDTAWRSIGLADRIVVPDLIESDYTPVVRPQNATAALQDAGRKILTHADPAPVRHSLASKLLALALVAMVLEATLAWLCQNEAKRGA